MVQAALVVEAPLALLGGNVALLVWLFLVSVRCLTTLLIVLVVVAVAAL